MPSNVTATWKDHGPLPEFSIPLDAEGSPVSNPNSSTHRRSPGLDFQFCSECLAETCVSTNFASCFLLLRELRLDLGDRVFVGCLTGCSWLITIFSLEGSSGGASGHGVRLDGTVISKGGSIIHL